MPMCLHVIFDLEANVVAPLLNWHTDGDDYGDALLLSGGVGLKKLKFGYVGKQLVVQLFVRRSLKTYGLILIYVESRFPI